jgi:DNA-3-methyladenine glycosylase II
MGMNALSTRPGYWLRASRELARRDPVMAGFGRRFRGMALRGRDDPFGTLARAIVGQQISVKAADTVWARLSAAVGQVSPDTIAAAAGGLAGCGLSNRKTEYLADLAAHFRDGRLAAGRWSDMDDEAVIADLTRVRGIGRWTAEMFLIFNLCRPDVLPADDIGLARAAATHYFAGSMPARPALLVLGERWRPWRSVATWYLWRSLDPVPVEY